MYFGESGRGLPTRLKEHKADLRHHRTSNALVMHAERTDHLPNWAGATVVHTGLSKLGRRAVEAAYITAEENIFFFFFFSAERRARRATRGRSVVFRECFGEKQCNHSEIYYHRACKLAPFQNTFSSSS